MPYRHAPYYVLFCVAVILFGFWPSYFAAFGSVPWQFHAHGVFATAWVLMVLVQSWTPHHGHLQLHRATGHASLWLFPFLIGGLMAIIDLTAKGFVQGEEVRVTFGGEFLIGLALAIAAYVVLFYRALKHRRKVWLHSGYMLATPLILFESPFSRVIGPFLPFESFLPSILLSMGLELAFVALLWWRLRDRAAPFLVAGVFIAGQMLGMGLLHRNPVLEWCLGILGVMPSTVVVGLGLVLGAATSWAGWQAGKRPAVGRGTAVPAG
nr:hypothetical protein [uncultured Sphingomonas sp.]